MTNDFDPDFKKKMRRLIMERLALEAVSGGSWKEALEGLKDIFDIDQAELERDIASLIEIRSWENGSTVKDEHAPIDLNAQRAQRGIAREISGEIGREIAKIRPKVIGKTLPKAKLSEGSGSYGSRVRAQVFEVIVRQGMAGAPWRSICAGPMGVNNIDPDEIQAEVDRRLKILGRDPQKGASDKHDDEQDDQPGDEPPKSGRGGGGKPKAPVPKNPFPFVGGAVRALPLPGKKRGKDEAARDIKSHDMLSHDQSSTGGDLESESDDESEV